MRVRTLWSVVAVLAMLLVSITFPLVGAVDQSTAPTGTNNAMPANDAFGSFVNGTTQTLNESQIQEATAKLQNPLFGPFNMTGNMVSGQFVSFTADPSTAMLSNYTLKSNTTSTTVFDSISMPGFIDANWQVNGPLFTGTNASMAVVIHNDQTGTIKAVNNGTGTAELNFSMPAGFAAATIPVTNTYAKAWVVMGNGVIGLLAVLNGTVNTSLPLAADMTALMNTTSTNASFADVMLQPGGACVFRALPVSEATQLANLLAINNALANWQVVSEVTVMSVDNATFFETSQFGMWNTMITSVTPGQSIVVNVSPSVMVATNATNSNLTNVSSGKLAVLTFDANTLNPNNGTWQVLVNGFQITQTMNALDFLNNTGQSNTYYVLSTPQTTTFVVSLPATGTVNITIQQASGSTGTTITASLAGVTAVAGVALLALVAVGAATVLLRRRH